MTRDGAKVKLKSRVRQKAGVGASDEAEAGNKQVKNGITDTGQDGKNGWSTGATWTCLGLLLAAGLAPCILFAIATHHYLWTGALILTLLVALAPSLYLTLFAGHKDLQLYVGSIYAPAGLWVLFWSFIPETSGWVRSSLFAAGCFLIALGALFLILYLPEKPDTKKAREAGGG